MKELEVAALCKIHDGKLDAFKAAAAACLQSVREKDTGTLQYDWFFNENLTECVVRERYRDSEAVLEHIANMGDAFGALLGTCDLSLEVFGDPSAELAEATSALPTRVYSFFQGA
jgi:quinol monooxygenase YgiN